MENFFTFEALTKFLKPILNIHNDMYVSFISLPDFVGSISSKSLVISLPVSLLPFSLNRDI